MLKKLKNNSLVIIFLALIFAFFLPTVASASTYGSGNYGSCGYNSCSLSIISNGSVSLNVSPTTSGSCTIQSDEVTVLTDDNNGYTLDLTNGNNNTNLTNGSSSINASNGTFTSPTSLVINTWGYRVDGDGGFGAGPTYAQSNSNQSGITFAGTQPEDGTPDDIASSSVAADPGVSTMVWYGVCADLSLTSGSYSSSITYTAIAN